ncbi:GNAT family acetyltransferase [Tanticharoenia sakaeratensis]|uniref:GCN5-like N-acetyltransferaser n=1 Tax=Tanticharoenia sakaeratensis NBRC 103193 TaxID=1231623 RepID=A0A0D6MLQ0_9PROT|nr:GNAT family acetyltransferase [Tanticharoenia sakaeratensis]GAN54602.1 GCN5-like N-acetyltransferaser [Tanticharoenia sakaeratensis NBRC 103193]GBQ22973.1 N-acetyltransferase GCN5 [Tanticharoenia sakaeratensis NBRC 103193]
MDHVIRPASDEDEAAVVDLWRASGLVAPYNDPAADFRYALGRPASDVLVVMDGAAVSGAVMVGHDGHRGWIYYLASHPDRRGQGIGRALVNAAEDWLCARACRKLQLMVRETNTGVVPFYERLGFENTPRVVMAKWLRP